MSKRKPEHSWTHAEDTGYWKRQKIACQKFEEDLERAGVKRSVGQPNEFDRPKLISPRSPEASGCSSPAGWDF
jgi:hypothetical protein